jgi:tetratricopeptide (TPR) repeat protein
VQFDEALKQGRLDEARSILDALAPDADADAGGLYLPECYADLAGSFDRRGQHDDAIAALECAIEHGWSGRPDPRSDIAESHLRAGRAGEAGQIWAQLKAFDPGDVWLYNAAGLSYSEVGDHALAVEWLADGIEVAMQTGDPEGIVPQMSEVRRRSLATLGRDLDDLDDRASRFVSEWRDQKSGRSSWAEVSRGADEWLAAPDVGEGSPRGGGEIAVAVSWFPAGEYEKAIERWESLAEDWAGVSHPDYCQRMDGHIKWMRAHGIAVRAVAPIVVDEFVAWCAEHGENPEHARAHYAAERFLTGEAIDWPPGRNETCWCRSGRKYKKCCGSAVAAPMHAHAAA